MRRAAGWAVRPDWVFPIPDVMSGIAEVLVAVTPHSSAWCSTRLCTGRSSCGLGTFTWQVVEAPLRRCDDGSYDLDFEVLDAALAQPDVSAYLLCNPHNPLGNVWSRDQLLTVADLCQRHEVALLVDEIHAPLALPGARAGAVRLARSSDGRTGLYLQLGHQRLEHPRAQVRDRGRRAGADRDDADRSLGGTARLASRRAGLGGGFPRSRSAGSTPCSTQLDENRQLLARLLSERLPEVGYVPGEASFLAWLDCRKLGLGDDPSLAFLERGQVALTGGPYFGSQGAGYARLNIGTSPELVTEAVRRMAASL